jgi:hypothetical protein
LPPSLPEFISLADKSVRKYTLSDKVCAFIVAVAGRQIFKR